MGSLLDSRGPLCSPRGLKGCTRGVSRREAEGTRSDDAKMVLPGAEGTRPGDAKWRFQELRELGQVMLNVTSRPYPATNVKDTRTDD